VTWRMRFPSNPQIHGQEYSEGRLRYPLRRRDLLISDRSKTSVKSMIQRRCSASLTLEAFSESVFEVLIATMRSSLVSRAL
jgi:hypothetical protein